MSTHLAFSGSVAGSRWYVRTVTLDMHEVWRRGVVKKIDMNYKKLFIINYLRSFMIEKI